MIYQSQIMALKFITLYLILQHFLVDAKVSIGVKVVVFAVKDNLSSPHSKLWCQGCTNYRGVE